MNRYIEITIETSGSEESDVFVARLSQEGFEGFEEEPKKLHAFIPETLFEVARVEEIISQIKGVADPFHSLFSIGYIEPRNWNADWEKDFDPVVVDHFCAIRAHFHAPVPDVKYDLIVTPKMSFGTGHHATTWMMISEMQYLDFIGRSVLDFGTGTGVLAILASKLGAASVIAIDNDRWSIENAVENAAVNGCEHIHVESRDTLDGLGRFDLILGNINLRVILENMEFLRQHLTESGVFTGSGVLESDEEKIRNRAAITGFTFERKMIKDNWMSFSLKISQS